MPTRVKSRDPPSALTLTVSPTHVAGVLGGDGVEHDLRWSARQAALGDPPHRQRTRVDRRAERRRGRPLDRLALLVDHHRVALHERLRIGDTIDRAHLVDDLDRQPIATLETEEALDRVRRLHVPVDAFEDIGEQRVERALHRVAEDERPAEERCARHDGECGQDDSSPPRPHAAQRQPDQMPAFTSWAHVVAIASMMSTLVARRAGITAAITPTMNDTNRITIVLTTGTVNTVMPSSRSDSTNRYPLIKPEDHTEHCTEHAGDHALPTDRRAHLAASHADRAEQPDLASSLVDREQQRDHDAHSSNHDRQRQQAVDQRQQLVDPRRLIVDVLAATLQLTRSVLDRPTVVSRRWLCESLTPRRSVDEHREVEVAPGRVRRTGRGSRRIGRPTRPTSRCRRSSAADRRGQGA